jgi:hypothetical protein
VFRRRYDISRAADAGEEVIFDPEKQNLQSELHTECLTYDPECQIIFVYRGIQEHWLSGEGWVFAYQIEDSTLKAADSVMLWIS